jgi:orotidine-5'-phosphate decarboxylase
MNRQELYEQISQKQSFLCIGLDTDPEKIPPFLLREEDPLFAFNKAIIDATHDLCIAYKPNVAFYECEGTKGWLSLEKTAKYIKTTYPELFLIADAKVEILATPPVNMLKLSSKGSLSTPSLLPPTWVPIA